MADPFYDRMRSVATRLVTKYNQEGTNEIVRVLTPNPDPFLPPTVSTDVVAFPAVVRGVSASLVTADPNLAATDLQVITDVTHYTPSIDDMVQINGSDRKVIRIDPIPAAGVPCAWRFFVR